MARVEGSGGGRGARHRGPLGNIPQQHNTVQHHNNGSQGNGLSSSMQGDQVGMEGVEFPMRMVCCMLGGWLTLLFGVMPFLAIYVVPLTPRDDLHWWNTGVIYHIYPRSFQDSNGDGIGDIKGITSRLHHLMDLGVDALWLGPVFKSPMKDFGYDISDYKDIDPVFGTMEDFEELVDTAHSKDLRVVLDVVPNHSSAEHPWFVQSRRREDSYSDYYVWHPGHVLNNGTRAPPNNWMSSFGSSAWTWDEVRREYYLHQFTKHQPDLNYRNPHVQREMEEVLRFWLGRGVDGFRVGAVDALYETDDLAQNEPRSYRENVFNTDWKYLRHSLTRQLPETYQLVSSWRRLFDQYEQETGKHVFLTLEVWSEERMEGWSRYYDHGADMPSNLAMMRHVTSNCAGRCLQRVVDTVLNHVPRDSWPNWAISNHDLGRISNRKSERYLSAMNMLLMTLPGLAFMYYGDEIGMRHISVSYEETQDPFGILSGPERYVTLSRDPCRSPMQWSSDAYSGFSKDSTPWLPVHSDYTFNNVQKQNKDSDSLLSSAKELISLRKQQALKWGFHRTATVTDDVYSFVRYTKGASYSKYLVAINLGDYPETVNFNDEPIGIKPRIPQTGRVVYHTKNFPPESAVAQYSTIHLSNVTLNGGQGIVVQL